MIVMGMMTTIGVKVGSGEGGERREEGLCWLWVRAPCVEEGGLWERNIMLILLREEE